MSFLSILRRISLKHVRHQKTQVIMSAAGICLGVAAMVSIDLVNVSVLRSFEDSINHITGRAALQITGADSGFPEAMLDEIRNVTGVEYAVPVIESNANMSGGTERTFLILGVDVLQDDKIRDYRVTDERAEIPDPLMFLAKSDSILLTREMAGREGIKIDRKIKVQTVQGIKTFTVRGLLDPEGPAKAAGGDVAVMDVYAAQMVFGKEGKIDRIDVSFLRGESLDTMKARIQAALPEGYSVDTPAERSRQVEILLSRYRKTIGFISFMALFVGMYLIYNAVSISVVHRRREIGILRAIGARQGQIIRLFLAETALISTLGACAGVGLGVVFAKLTIGAVAQSVTDFYIKTSVSELTYSLNHIIKNAGLGILASLAAAAFPAIASSRITPISAIRALPYSQDGSFLSRKIKHISGIFIFLSAAIMTVYKTSGQASGIRNTATPFLSMILLLIGVSLFTPSFLKWFMAFFHRHVSSRLGAGGRLAGLNLEKNISRNAVAVAAVFFSIALFVQSAGMISSIQESALDYIDAVEQCDILISSGHPIAMGGAPSVPMPGELVRDIEKVPGVLAADPFRKNFVSFKGRRTFMVIIDIILSMEYNKYMITDGKREDIRRLLPGQDNILINESVAARHGIRPGDSIVLPTPGGPRRFGVVATVVSYASDSGVIVMDIHTYRKYWQDGLVDSFSVRVKPTEDISKVREAILDRLGKDRKLYALNAREFKGEVRRMLDRTFVLNNAVNVLTLIIAGFGIIVTLLASVLERTREIGILRSIGMMRRQVSGVVLIESSLIGAAGGLLGTAAGILTGWISLESFFRLDLGASVTYHLHYASIGWALLLSAILSAVAGLYPARRAAKTNISEALTYE